MQGYQKHPAGRIQQSNRHGNGRAAAPDVAMSLQLSIPSANAMPRLQLRRVARGLVLLAIVALWLLAIPALLTRDGLSRHDGACPTWRDPVTGRTLPLRPRDRDIACVADMSMVRR
jgi:hypothetical protein